MSDKCKFLFSFIRIFFLGYLVLTFQHVSGQNYDRPVFDTVKVQGVRYRTEVSGLVGSSNATPFWLHSNQFGAVPLESPTGIISIGAVGLWGNAKQNRKPYLKVSVEAVGFLNRASQLVLPEAYVSGNWRYIELYVGRRKEINGLVDTLLTSGSVAWSGNAVPITQIRLGTKGFAPLKFTRGLLSINAFFSHGWFANTDSMQKVMLHAKSLFVRVGKPTWKFRLYAGVNHFVQWGGYSPYLPTSLAQDGHIASNWKAYKNVVLPFGSPGGDDQLAQIDTLNQVGNHLGSIDFGTDIQFQRSNLFIYHQHIFEDNSGIKFQNFPDGLFGIRWKNLSSDTKSIIQFKQITTEFLTTLSRSGTDPIYGNDDYFYNGQYIGGWTHKGNVIGTPIFTKTADIPVSFAENKPWFNRTTGVKNFNIARPVNNNAVQSLHVGLYALAFNKIPIVLMMTAVKYYEWPNTDKNYNQFYSVLAINNISLNYSGNLKVGIKVAYDTGEIFTRNFGVMLKVVKNY